MFRLAAVIASLQLAACSQVVYSVKHKLDDKSKIPNIAISGKSNWSYNTGFKRSVLVVNSAKPGEPPNLTVKPSDSDDETYDLYYSESSWLFSDLFAFKVDENGRLDTNNVKATSDLGVIIADISAIARATSGYTAENLDGNQPEESCTPEPAKHDFVNRIIQLCPSDKLGKTQEEETEKGDDYNIEVDCTKLPVPTNEEQHVGTGTRKDLLDWAEGLLVYDAKPIRLTINRIGVKWSQPVIDPKTNKPAIDIKTNKSITKSCTVSKTMPQKIPIAVADIAFPVKLHAIPIKRNLLTSPETTVSAKNGFFLEYKKSETGILKGFLEIITAPLKGFFPTVTVTDGKSSSTYKSQ